MVEYGGRVLSFHLQIVFTYPPKICARAGTHLQRIPQAVGHSHHAPFGAAPAKVARAKHNRESTVHASVIFLFSFSIELVNASFKPHRRWCYSRMVAATFLSCLIFPAGDKEFSVMSFSPKIDAIGACRESQQGGVDQPPCRSKVNDYCRDLGAFRRLPCAHMQEAESLTARHL